MMTPAVERTFKFKNGDIAAELGLEGRPHERTVNVLNDIKERLDTTVVEFMISSCDGKVFKLYGGESHRKHASGGLEQTQALVNAPKRHQVPSSRTQTHSRPVNSRAPS